MLYGERGEVSVRNEVGAQVFAADGLKFPPATGYNGFLQLTSVYQPHTLDGSGKPFTIKGRAHLKGVENDD